MRILTEQDLKKAGKDKVGVVIVTLIKKNFFPKKKLLLTFGMEKKRCPYLMAPTFWVVGGIC